MRRVVVTGLGIVSSLGNNIEEVTTSLRNGTSGITYCEEYKEMGFRSHIHGSIKLNPSEYVDRKVLRFMGDGAAYAYIAMQQAIADSGLKEEEVSNFKTGLVAGSGGPSTSSMLRSFDTAREKNPKRVGPYMVQHVLDFFLLLCQMT